MNIISSFSNRKWICVTYERHKNRTERERIKKPNFSPSWRKYSRRNEKENDKQEVDDWHHVACFDLQAALRTPKGDISSIHNKCKLLTHSFIVRDLQKEGPVDFDCNLWHGFEGKWGSMEIGSCLLQYLDQVAVSSNDRNLEIHSILIAVVDKERINSQKLLPYTL